MNVVLPGVALDVRIVQAVLQLLELPAELARLPRHRRRGRCVAPHVLPQRLLRVLRSEEHTSELQSLAYLVCRLLLEKKKKSNIQLMCSTRRGWRLLFPPYSHR